MAKSSKRQASSDDALSNGSNSSEEERIDDQINGEEEDEEEIEAVARPADASDEDEDAALDENVDDADEVILRFCPFNSLSLNFVFEFLRFWLLDLSFCLLFLVRVC